jgi:hypothetical protein
MDRWRQACVEDDALHDYIVRKFVSDIGQLRLDIGLCISCPHSRSSDVFIRERKTLDAPDVGDKSFLVMRAKIGPPGRS